MTSACKSGSVPKKFCSIRADKNCAGCPAGTKTYAEVCKPEVPVTAKNWADVTYTQLVRTDKGIRRDKKAYEAHHILCVSPVTKELVGNKTIKAAIEETEWCINNGENMIAMPLWGHTVQHYCKITKSKLFLPKDVPPPPFENLPQHNIDHNSKEGYTYEITKECQRLVKDIIDSEHQLKGESLKGVLDGLSSDWRIELKSRGTDRKGGTHNAWKLAWDDPPDPDWFHPFSMASEGKISKMGFPVHKFDDKVAAWIERLANTMT
jgi:A nuclease family of the HNH/ENDO VII superfamily with conserved AHH